MGSNGTTTRPLEERTTGTAELPVLRTAPAPLPATTNDPGGEEPEAPTPVGTRPRRAVPRTVWFFVVIAVLGLCAALGVSLVIRALGDANPFKGGLLTQRTVDRSGPAVLQAVNDLGTLQSASGHYEMVVDLEQSVDNVPSFLAGRRTLFVAVGDVGTTVDLRNLPAGSVTVNADRTAATLHLPRPRLSTPQIDVQRSHVFSEDRGLGTAIADAFKGTPDQQQELYRLASTRLTQAAQANGELVSKAEANTRATLQGLLRPLGFTQVTILFDR